LESPELGGGGESGGAAAVSARGRRACECELRSAKLCNCVQVGEDGWRLELSRGKAGGAHEDGRGERGRQRCAGTSCARQAEKMGLMVSGRPRQRRVTGLSKACVFVGFRYSMGLFSWVIDGRCLEVLTRFIALNDMCNDRVHSASTILLFKTVFIASIQKNASHFQYGAFADERTADSLF
jgi:hypothetical protein